VSRIYQLGLAASAATDLEEPVTAILRVILDATGAAGAAIVRVDEARGEAILRWSLTAAGGILGAGGRAPLAGTLAGRAVAAGRAVTAAARDHWPFPARIALAAAAPLAIGARGLGALVLAAPAPAEARLMERLERLAGPVALALQNVLVLEDGRHRVTQLAMLGRVSHIITSTVDLETLLQRTVDCIREQLGYEVVAIGLVDPKRERVVLRAVSAAQPITAAIGHSQALGEGVTGECARTGRSRLVPDVRDCENYVAVTPRARSEMCCALKVGDRVIGALDVESDTPGSLDGQDLMVLEAIAEHIAQAVQNAQALRDVARVREELAAMLIHDLRTPITVVVAALDLMRGSDRNLPAVRQAQSACEEMLVLIGGILDLQKLEAGAFKVHPRLGAPGDLAHGVLRRLGVVAATRRVSLEAAVDDATPGAPLDADLIARVLENLVVNALKFTPAGGCVTVEVAPQDAPGAGRELPGGGPAVRFTVRDTGPGIPPEHRERIFDKFAVVEARRAGARHSTGLGLAFCRQAVEAHGGVIWVDPAARSGSVFHLLLPAGRPRPAPRARRRPR
jgi:signal transduction histidine kinase